MDDKEYTVFDGVLSLCHPSNTLTISTQARPRASTTLCLPMEVFVSLHAVILTSCPHQRFLECNQGRGLLPFLAGEVGDNVGQQPSSQGHEGHGGKGPHHYYDHNSLSIFIVNYTFAN